MSISQAVYEAQIQRIADLRARLAEANDSLVIAQYNCEAQAEANITLKARLAEAEAKIAELREALGCEMDDTRNACGVLNDELDRVNKRLADKEILLAEAVEYGTGYKQAYDEAMANYQVALARLAEAEVLIAKGLAVVHDFLPNIGRCVLQDYQRMNEFCSEAAARTAVSAVQPERCCVDYPRCDCNSPAEWPTREEAEKRAAELMAIGRATLAAADRQVPEGMALHKGEFVTARMVVERLAEAESAYLSAWARLVKEERLHGYAMEERDHAEEMADKLADAIATLLGVEIGEHSNMNCPWEQALEAFEGRAASTVTQDAAP